MTKKIYFTIFMILITAGLAKAQSSFGEIRGKITDKSSGAPVDYAMVVAELNGVQKGNTYTEEDGTYIIKTLPPGKYTIKVFEASHNPIEITGITVVADEISYVNGKLPFKNELKEIEVIVYKDPIIKPDENKKTINREMITKMGTRNLNTITNTASGTYSLNGGTPSFRGSRVDGTRYFIDGVPVLGSAVLPQAMIDQVNIIQGGVPAQYGDFTGGGIAQTTRGPSLQRYGSFEAISSSPFNKYHYNQIEASLLGPLIRKKTATGERAILGYAISAQLNFQADPDPSAIGTKQLKADKLDEIKQNPLVPNPRGTGFVTASSFLTADDFEKYQAKQNAAFYRGIGTVKLDYQPTEKTTITFFGSVNLTRQNIWSLANSIMNYEQNPIQDNNTYRAYLKFNQRFGQVEERGKPTPLITNAYYSVRLDYQNNTVNTYDPTHKDRIFDYGYIGKFTEHPTASYIPQSNAESKMFIDQNGDTVYLRNYYEQVGYADTLLTFERAELNPLRANYTSSFYNQTTDPVRSETQVLQGLGLLNGYNAPSLYNLFLNPGGVVSGYDKSQNERYSVFAIGEATVNNRKNSKLKHDLQFGLQYEQTIYRRYNVYNANGLWFLMPQLVNKQLSLDKDNPYLVYDENGVFMDTIKYATKVDPSVQTSFDKNFRSYLISKGAKDVYGNPITEESFIDVNSYSPSDFKMDYFSADELLNNGNSYLSYFGYDYLGRKSKIRPSLNDFLNDPSKRSIGAYAPVYSAGWIQDKFAFKDLIFRLGVRVERFDANQYVLKDPYTLYPAYSKGEVKSLNGVAVNHPSNIGDDYTVYVNDVNNPTAITGYRKDNKWYDANGTEVANPDLIAQLSPSGRIQPYLVDPNNQRLTTASFKDYTPQVNVLPRVWFSFPINDKSLFFASYDVLAQRPNDGITFITIDDYYYMQQRVTSTFANPALKPRLKTDYEIGFKQEVTSNSGLSIIASYSEIRNDFNQYRFNQAYPVSYTSYANIDFSTVKGFRIEYEQRGKKLNMSANYTLQFAEGTGSNVNSAAALIASQQPNLRSLFPLDVDIRHNVKLVFDYRFSGGRDAEGKDMYNGPTWGRWLWEFLGANVILNSRSGAPYTATTQPVALGSLSRSQVKGTVFGSRLPWQTTVNVNIDKTFRLNTGKDKNGKQKYFDMNVFLWIENILNTKNVVNVYQYTGDPMDDGYLNSPQGQQTIATQVSAQSYMDIYTLAMQNPNNYALPRQTRLGLKFNF